MRARTRFLSVLIASALTVGAGEVLAQGPIKIGFISPISGAVAQTGRGSNAKRSISRDNE